MAPSEVFVSVIMTSYNYAEHIRKAVESVLSQSFSNFELIIVDDGSSDASLDVLSRYKKDPRVKIIAQENQGQAAAINRAYQDSRGEILSFIDSDDWWDKDKLTKVVKYHCDLKGRYGILQHNLTVAKGEKRYPYKKTLVSAVGFEEIRQTDQIDFFVTTSGLSLTREVLDKIIPIPTVLKVSPDAYLTRAALVFGSVYSIQECLGYLRLHPRNAGMGKEKEFHQKLRKEVIYSELNRFYERFGIDYKFGDQNEKSFSSQKGFYEKLKSFLRNLKNRCG